MTMRFAAILLLGLLGGFAQPESTWAQSPERAGPRIILRLAPIYPKAAIDRELSGHVTVEFTIGELGAPRDVVVVQSSDPVFEDAAVEAIRRWRYDDTSVSRRVRETLEFDLELELVRIRAALENPGGLEPELLKHR